MKDKINIILKKLIKEGIDMNAFLKISGESIKEKIVEAVKIYYKQENKSKYKIKSTKLLIHKKC